MLFSLHFFFILILKDAPVQSTLNMNNLLTDMYRTNAAESRGPAAQNDFPIDISSDESDIDEPMQKNTNNGKPIVIFFVLHSRRTSAILVFL